MQKVKSGIINSSLKQDEKRGPGNGYNLYLLFCAIYGLTLSCTYLLFFLNLLCQVIVNIKAVDVKSLMFKSS